MLALLLSLSAALASGGPWVPGEGQAQLYVGLDAERFVVLRVFGTEDGVADVPIAGGMSTIRTVGELSYGIASRVEVSLSVPVQHAYIHRPSDPLCGVFGLGACRPTTSVGIVEGRVKGLFLDQVSGAPLSAAIGGVVRFGGLTASTRERFTNAGEGTTDLGGRLSLGRSGTLGGGYYVGQLDVQGLYRLPINTAFPRGEGDLTVPGAEVSAAADLLLAPVARVSFGPTVTFASRPSGLDIGEMLGTAVDDPDRFAGINYTEVRAGGKLILQDERYNAVSLSVLRMAWAKNTPKDTFGVSLGVTIADLLGADE